jgi:hypothetical protein
MNTSFKELYFKYKQNGIENFPNTVCGSVVFPKVNLVSRLPIQSYSAKLTSATDKG